MSQFSSPSFSLPGNTGVLQPGYLGSVRDPLIPSGVTVGEAIGRGVQQTADVLGDIVLDAAHRKEVVDARFREADRDRQTFDFETQTLAQVSLAQDEAAKVSPELAESTYAETLAEWAGSVESIADPEVKLRAGQIIDRQTTIGQIAVRDQARRRTIEMIRGGVIERSASLLNGVGTAKMSAVEASAMFEDAIDDHVRNGVYTPDDAAVMVRQFRTDAARQQFDFGLGVNPRWAKEYVERDDFALGNLSADERGRRAEAADAAIAEADQASADATMESVRGQLHGMVHEQPGGASVNADDFGLIVDDMVSMIRAEPAVDLSADEVRFGLIAPELQLASSQGDERRFDLLAANLPRTVEGDQFRVNERNRLDDVIEQRDRVDAQTRDIRDAFAMTGFSAAGMSQRTAFAPLAKPPEIVAGEPAWTKWHAEQIAAGKTAAELAAFETATHGAAPDVLRKDVKHAFDAQKAADGLGILHGIASVDPLEADIVARSTGDLALAAWTATKSLNPLIPADAQEIEAIVRDLSHPRSADAVAEAAKILNPTTEKEKQDPAVNVGASIAEAFEFSGTQNLGAGDFEEFQAQFIVGYARAAAAGTAEEGRTAKAEQYATEQMRRKRATVHVPGAGAFLMRGDLGLGNDASPFRAMEFYQIEVESMQGRQRATPTGIFRGTMLGGVFGGESGGAQVRPDLAFAIDRKVYTPAIGATGPVEWMEFDADTTATVAIGPDDEAFAAFTEIAAKRIPADQRYVDAHLRWRPEYGARSVEAYDRDVLGVGPDDLFSGMRAKLANRAIGVWTSRFGDAPDLRDPETKDEFDAFLEQYVRSMQWPAWTEAAKTTPGE